MALRRSILLVGGNDESTLRAGIASSADVVCLDLEDTVAVEHKAAARRQIAALLAEDIWGRSARAYRINGVATPYAHDDIVEVVRGSGGRVDLIFMSKVESDHDVWWADQLLSRLGEELGLSHQIRLAVGIESAKALTRIDAIAAASPRVEALGFAIGDLNISLGVRIGQYLHDRSLYPGDLNHFTRSRINLAAKAHGLLALDGPWPMINDHATLDEDARWSAMLGYDGKIALSAEQVPVIHQAFRPTAAEVARAELLIRKFQEALARGEAHGLVDGEFIDPVTLGLMRATLERAAAPV
jgi:citrate lyase subunit beta / citryl-CoA lyase